MFIEKEQMYVKLLSACEVNDVENVYKILEEYDINLTIKDNYVLKKAALESNKAIVLLLLRTQKFDKDDLFVKKILNKYKDF